MENIRQKIREVPDFPIPGILFRDITPLLRDHAAMASVIEQFRVMYAGRGIDCVAGIESRGFIFGVPLALALGCGFVPIRKLGKLPRRTIAREYALEYGTNHLEMHADAVAPGERVLIVDDLLATGGTARATAEIVETAGGVVAGIGFLVELSALGGRQALQGWEVSALVAY